MPLRITPSGSSAVPPPRRGGERQGVRPDAGVPMLGWVARRRVASTRKDATATALSRLRLTGQASVQRRPSVSEQALAPIGQPITSPTDPRWVLAIRTAAELNGEVLPADRRQRLLRLGRLLGLTPFDTNLIIAIVQDQARRGFAPEYCPLAGEPQLAMVARPADRSDHAKRQRWLYSACLLAALLAIELLLIKWLLT